MATIKNLNESLMKRIEALENDELTQEEMELEIKKSMAITKVDDTLVNCARMALLNRIPLYSKLSRSVTCTGISLDKITAASCNSFALFSSPWRL